MYSLNTHFDYLTTTSDLCFTCFNLILILVSLCPSSDSNSPFFWLVNPGFLLYSPNMLYTPMLYSPTDGYSYSNSKNQTLTGTNPGFAAYELALKQLLAWPYSSTALSKPVALYPNSHYACFYSDLTRLWAWHYTTDFQATFPVLYSITTTYENETSESQA